MTVELKDRGAVAHVLSGGICYLVAVGALSALWVYGIWNNDPKIFESRRFCFHLYRTLYTGVPLVGLIGMGVGWGSFFQRWPNVNIYWSRSPVANRFLGKLYSLFVMCALMAFFLNIPLVMLWAIQTTLRRILYDTHPKFRAPGFALAWFLIAFYVASNFLIRTGDCRHAINMVVALIIVFLSAIGAGDCLLALLTSHWSIQRRVPEPPDSYQYSLGSFVGMVMLLGLWATGLFHFYR